MQAKLHHSIISLPPKKIVYQFVLSAGKISTSYWMLKHNKDLLPSLIIISVFNILLMCSQTDVKMIGKNQNRKWRWN